MEDRAEILFLEDDRIRAKCQSKIDQALLAAQSIYKIKIKRLKGDATEDQLLEVISKRKTTLILVPWDFYLKYRNIEAELGFQRTKGTVFCGYFTDAVPASKISLPRPQVRLALFDFFRPPVLALAQLLASLSMEHKRSGALPLLEPDVPLYYDFWTRQEGIGRKIDRVLGLPSFKRSHFAERKFEVMSVMAALWEISQRATDFNNDPQLPYFQVGFGQTYAVFRLNSHFGKSTAKNILSEFWPRQTVPSSPISTLYKCANMIRAHHIHEANYLELTVTLTNNMEGAKRPKPSIPTLWIEPLAHTLVSELPQEERCFERPELVALSSRVNDSAQDTLSDIDKGKVQSLLQGGYDRIKRLKAELDISFERIEELEAELQELKDKRAA